MEEEGFTLGSIIKETGDFGLFQILMIGFTNVALLSLNWSMMTMAFSATVPDWTCYVDEDEMNSSVGVLNQCDINGTACSRIVFDDSLSTVVNQWELICDKKWVSQTMTTIQMCGLLIGGLFWGHVSDGIGRKPTFYLNILFLMVFNMVAFFSVNWEMFAAMRFLIGFACTGFMSSSVMFEYIRNKWRIYLYLIPGWASFASLMALFCWRVHDWRYIHIVIAASTVPVLFTWFIIPESFRWLSSHGKLKEATKCIGLVARINRKPEPDVSRIEQVLEKERKEMEKTKALQVYTVLDLFRTPQLRKITILFSIVWAFSSYSYYGIAFGIQELSGNLYLNMFLVSVVDIPGNYLLVVFNRWGGRRWTNVGFYIVGGGFALAVGIIQFTKMEISGALLNGLALSAKLCISAGWEINTLWSSESFPTVVRNIGGGFISSISRIGSMVAPQIITLSKDTPGLLYFISGMGTLISAFLCAFLQETKNRDLDDLIPVKHKVITDIKSPSYTIETVKPQPHVQISTLNQK